MKHISSYVILFAILLSAGMAACNEDHGNYNYIPEDEWSVIEIDTTGLGSERYVWSGTYNVGDTIHMAPKVKYDFPENLKYSWLVYKYPYAAVQVGNAMIYPKPDTICRTLEINYIVNVAAGDRYTPTLLVQDTVRGSSASMQMASYFTVSKQGARTGVFILSEYDGQSDIDYYASALCLIYNGRKDTLITNYYSKSLNHGMLPGKPLFMSYGQDYYYVFTETNGYRLNNAGLVLMEEFDDMFYQTPAYRPQALNYINSCEFFINDGKLHVMYTNKTNDRKFSAPIGGNYTAGAYLSDATRTSYGAVTGAINADQVIFDTQSKGFKPYFPQSSAISEFANTVGDAVLDAKALPAAPIWAGGGQSGKTYAVLDDGGKRYLYILNFYNVVDDGDLCGDGTHSIIDLSGCTDIMNAKYFVGNYNGWGMAYATDTKVYAFSPSSGATTSTLVYECPAGETVTCINYFFRHASGGFPTPGCILWIGVWNESAKVGKLVEFEIDTDYSTPVWQWGTSFAPTHTNPQITTGFGKIKSIVSR